METFNYNINFLKGGHKTTPHHCFISNIFKTYTMLRKWYFGTKTSHKSSLSLCYHVYNTIKFYCSNRFTKCDLKVHTKLQSICSKPVVRQLGYRLSLWGKHMASAITLPYSCTVIANGMNGHTTACVRNTFPFTWSSITL